MPILEWVKLLGPIILEVIRIIFKSPQEATKVVKEKQQAKVTKKV